MLTYSVNMFRIVLLALAMKVCKIETSGQAHTKRRDEEKEGDPDAKSRYPHLTPHSFSMACFDSLANNHTLFHMKWVASSDSF